MLSPLSRGRQVPMIDPWTRYTGNHEADAKSSAPCAPAPRLEVDQESSTVLWT